jgi:hypothetical protein
MLYKNKKTGAVIEFKSRISSDVWELAEEQAPKPVFEAQVKAEPVNDENSKVAPVQPKKTTSKKKKAE